MRLVTNHGGLSHRTAIKDVLKGAAEATLSVAFLKEAGALYMEPLLRGLTSKGGRAVAFIGTDFYLTEPAALAILLKLADRQPRFEVFMGSRMGPTFHPKVYAAVKGQRIHCLVGSANLTGGALGENDETSLLVETAVGSDLHVSLKAEWTRLRSGGRFDRLDQTRLNQYRRSYKAVQARRRELDAAIAKVAEAEFDLTGLDAQLGLYRADEKAMAGLQQRGRDRKLARRVQTALAGMDNSGRISADDRAIFEARLTDLMSGKGEARHLWPSDAIFRQGTKTLSRPREMIGLFKLGQQASRRPLAEGFDQMRRAAQEIPGAGVNMITEILATFAPDRYAVLNGNTAVALRGLGFEAPKTLTVDALRGERYAAVAAVIGDLRDRIGAEDFPETDAFLNWLYEGRPR